MKIYCARHDLMMLDVEPQSPDSLRAPRDFREVPDDLIAQYETAFDELDRISDLIEKAYGARDGR